MPRIKMHTLMAGPHGSRHPGVEYDVSDSEARTLLEARCASLVRVVGAPVVVERAVINAPENATAPAQRQRPRGGGK